MKTSANPQHPSIQVEYNGTLVDIDQDIAPLIQELWRVGLNTTQCCQARRNLASNIRDEGPERVWIQFETREMAKTFIERVLAQVDKEDENFHWETSIGKTPSKRSSVYFSPGALPIVMRAFNL